MLNCSSYFLAMFISSIAMLSRREGVEGIFYRNIPFQYKTAANVERPKSIADIGGGTNNDDQIATKGEGGNGIRALLNEIEAEDSRQLLADGDGSAGRSRTSFPRRTARLIPLLPSGGSINTNTDQQQPLESEMEQLQPKFVQQGQKSSSPSSSSASSLQSLIALRPDYAFKNVADFLRNFFDSRIERSRKNVAGDGRTAADWRAARSMQV
uniref:Uncharacterized protein n=1 Tax=Globodera rostochiensis TaxID=31243 RepID=A0A914H542_GLORO